MTPEERVPALREELRTVAVSYCNALADVERCATLLADLEGRLRAAQYQVGTFHDPLSPARELAAEALHGRVSALRPYVPFVTGESSRRAEEALVLPPCIEDRLDYAGLVQVRLCSSSGAVPEARLAVAVGARV